MNHIAGFLAGITAAMGLGGGFILIIYLSFFEDISQSAAGGINLLFFLPIALLSAIIHLKHGLVEKKLLPVICMAGVAGAVCGALLMSVLDEGVLRKLFAGLLLFVGIRELLGGVARRKVAKI
jgi:hypothetical protein